MTLRLCTLRLRAFLSLCFILADSWVHIHAMNSSYEINPFSYTYVVHPVILPGFAVSKVNL